jgi:hypothetical protein
MCSIKEDKKTQQKKMKKKKVISMKKNSTRNFTNFKETTKKFKFTYIFKNVNQGI